MHTHTLRHIAITFAQAFHQQCGKHIDHNGKVIGNIGKCDPLLFLMSDYIYIIVQLNPPFINTHTVCDFGANLQST